MSRRILDLGTLPWQLGQVPRQPYHVAPADDRSAVRDWLPATVPGDVRADLIAAGRIPPVETPEGIAASAWVDGCDWWYRAELPGGWASGGTIVLEADGIDYCSAIWLDDRLLATHEGMSARQVVVLPLEQGGPGPHELAIRIWGGGSLRTLPNPLSRRALRRLFKLLSPGFEYYPNRMAVPKAQFSFGWDFSPRLLSMGLWDGLRLVGARNAYIEDLWVRAEPLSEGDPTPTRWRLRLRVHGRQAQRLRVEVIIGQEGTPVGPESCAADDQGTPLRVGNIELREVGADDFDLEFATPSARRWWPWDQGEPYLYRVTVRLADEAGPVDETSHVTGVRTVARTTLPDGNSWQFVVNGRPVFLRGANWVPADVLPGRVRPEDYTRLLQQARAAGINFLRVWGGGLREKFTFWELCDRLGILAWQEFPLACAFFDHYPREQDYLETLAAEARGTVRLLRNHPSLIAWCGGNEINPLRERIPLETIAGVLRKEDPDRPWIPASPSGGEEHQWQVWHGYVPWTDLARSRAPFMSEFGLQALPDATSIGEMFGGDPPASLTDPRWVGRKAQTDKLRHYAGPDADQELATAIAATQRVQAAAIQAGLEACRLRRHSARGFAERPGTARDRGSEAPSCGGVAFWQFNEPWPAVTWSVIDRAGRPKAAYETLQHCYQPVLIAARFPRRLYGAGEMFRAEIWLVNDGPATWRSCHAEALLDGEPVWAAANLEMRPASAARVGDLACRLSAPPRTLGLCLTCGDAEVASNFYDLAVPIAAPGRWRSRLNQRLATWLLHSD